jgi:hypothetical protein
MNRRIFLALVMMVALLFAGCTKAKIEDAIQDFESAVNDYNQSALDSLLADASLFKATGPPGVAAFLDYFEGFRPVSYSGLDIDVNGSDADAHASASYAGSPISALFIMKKEGSDWKVREYHDTNNAQQTLQFVWHKVQELMEKKIAP